MYFILQLINGLQIGSIYALIALGYTMVYGIVKLINFAHGDIMMVGSYVLMVLLVRIKVPLFAAIPLAMVVCALSGILIEKVAYRPLRRASRLSALITAIAVSLFLQNLFMLIFSPNPLALPLDLSRLPMLRLGGAAISASTLISIGSAILLMFILTLFVNRTKTGKAMLAVSEDMKAAQLMGINVDHTISVTFAIGSALAAFAAALYVIAYPQISPFMGSIPGIKAFIAAVLGGIGIIPGAMIGGFLLGIAETLTRGFIPSGLSQLSDGVVFLILILVLLYKPTGILGRNQREKV